MCVFIYGNDSQNMIIPVEANTVDTSWQFGHTRRKYHSATAQCEYFGRSFGLQFYPHLTSNYFQHRSQACRVSNVGVLLYRR
jgi:hypothetical protein